MRSRVLALAVLSALAFHSTLALAQDQEEAATTTQEAGNGENGSTQQPPEPPPILMPTGPELPPDPGKPQINAAEAELSATRGHRAAGRLLLSPDNFGLRISGRITGLGNDAVHGFHVHEVGDCGDEAAAAGNHFNPGQHNHGNPESSERHAGDLPNLEADNRGTVDIDLTVRHLTLGDEGENDILGRSLVIHADADDYTSQPAGASGTRIACGVIQAVPAPELRPEPEVEQEAAGNG